MNIVNKPDMNYGTWAENGNIEIPSSEKVEEGWVVEKPLNEQANWVENRQDKMLQYLNQRGLGEWDSRTEYPVGAYATRSGLLYKATSQNQDADPTLNTEIWFEPYASKTGLGSTSEEIEKIKNNDGYLEHYVRKSAPVMTSIAKGIGYYNSTGSVGFGFSNDTPVIKIGNTTIIEFSGSDNPKDVVTHEQLELSLQIYKVDDIYITMGTGDPFDRLGYGVWERFAEGSVLVGLSASVSNETPQWVKTAGSEYGEYDHLNTIEEMARHNHVAQIRGSGGGQNTNTYNPERGAASANGHSGIYDSGVTIEDAGESKPHNNVQPSIVVHMWKRTA
jgi:hypothetical protein